MIVQTWLGVLEQSFQELLSGIVSFIPNLLFAVVNLARHLRVPPETALHDANRRFIDSTRRIERLARERGLRLADLDPEERDRLWRLAKPDPP